MDMSNATSHNFKDFLEQERRPLPPRKTLPSKGIVISCGSAAYAEIGATVHLGRCPMPTYNTVVSIIEDLKSWLDSGADFQLLDRSDEAVLSSVVADRLSVIETDAETLPGLDG